MSKKTTALIVLDGWGHNESPEYNAIHSANSPVWDDLWSNRPTTLISGSGIDVGLPDGQMGNSEVGHMTLGAGRVVWQSFTRIENAIETGEFFENAVYQRAIDHTVEKTSALHVIGLLSPGGVHSHESHIEAIIKMAADRGAQKVYLHAILDGRDTPPRSAESSLKAADNQLRSMGIGRVASVCGRYYSMDRDNRWERVEPAYRLVTEGDAEYQSQDPISALLEAYERDENDEFVKPTAIVGENERPAKVDDQDVMIFMNFRADRARQITRAFVDSEFDGFTRPRKLELGGFVTTTEYAADIDAPVAFPPVDLANSFGDYLSSLGKTQLRIAETEKYAHVTFFFSGGQEELFVGEERELIPSPNVATYDLQPEMSAPELTDKLCAAIESEKFDAIICNYANGDMVGHTGIFEAAVAAVEAVDACLARIVESLQKVGGQCLITADHGNVERMRNPENGQPLTSHTSEPVPLVYVGDRTIQLSAGGTLADIAPTLLALMELKQPPEMSGRNLIKV